jgi:hypothetical protein
VTGFNPAVAGSYTFTYTETNGFGCSTSCNFDIIVNPLPTFDCPTYGSFCEGENAFVFSGPGVYTFEGAVVTGFDPVVAGSYTFTYTETNGFGCSTSCNFDIIVNSLPVFDCPLYGPFCEGDEGIIFEGTGVYLFEGAVVTGFDPAVAGSYTFTYTETNGFGCSTSCNFEIIVNPLPVFDCPSYGPFCEGDEGIIFEGTGVYTFEGAVVTGFDPLVAGSYTFTYTETNGFGCMKSCAFQVIVNSGTTVSAGANATIYAGQTYTLSNASAGNFSSLLWTTSGNGTFNATNILKPIYTPGQGDISAGTVQLCLKAIAIGGCPDAVSCLTLTINQNLVPIISLLPSCINLTLIPGQTYRREILISNTGFQELDFNINVLNNVGWMTFSPITGNIQSGNSKSINLDFDATGLTIGDYFVDIVISSNDPDNDTVVVPITLKIVDSIIGQSIHLKKGWSLISSNRIPQDASPDSIFKNQIVCSTFKILIGKQGIFWPEHNLNTLGYWNPYEAYKLKMSVDDQWINYGQMVENKTVDIATGWSYLPVLSSCPVLSSDIFGQIENQLVFAFDLDGFVYWPSAGLFTLDTLFPGKGYYISMNSNGSVTFPECDSKQTAIEPFEPKSKAIENIPWTITNTGSYHIVSVYSSVLSNFAQGDIIAAFNREGSCVGMSEINDLNRNLGLVIYGDDFTTESVDGMLENEPINLRLYKPGTREEYELDFVFDPDMPNYLPEFVNNGLSGIISLKAVSNLVNDDNEIFNVQIYPNPAENEFVVSIGNHTFKSCKLNIYQIDGLLLKSIEVTSNKTTIGIADLTLGVYLVNIEINGSVINRRLIKQ